MKFEKELFNGYDIVYNRYTGRIKELKDFIDMLSKKYNFEVDYSNSIKDVAETSIFLVSENSVSEGMNSVKNFFFNQNTYFTEFLSNVKDEVLDPLKEMLKEIKSKGSKLNEDFRKSEKILNETLEKVERARDRYYLNSKQENENKVKLEELKYLSLTEEQKNKFISKTELLASETKESEVSYIYQVDYTNNLRERHFQLLRNTLSAYQRIEENYIETVKDCLRKFNIYEVAMVRNMQYDLEKQAKINESINHENDVNKFIEKNVMNITLPKKIEFIPFSDSINVENIPKSSGSIFGSVKDFFNSKINYMRKSNDEEQIDEKINKEIHSTLQFIWEGNILPIERKIIILKFLREKKYRKTFFDGVNKYRIKGEFVLNENNYAVLGDLLLNILDEIVKAKDYESFKYCLILSQTFYKNSKENHKPRIFLQNAIEIHPVCIEVPFWEEVIKYSIEDEIQKDKKLMVYSFDSSSEIKKRQQNLIFGQLVSFSFNILSFDVKKATVKEILLKYAQHFDLSQDLTDSLISNVDSYNTKNEDESATLEIFSHRNKKDNEEKEKAEINMIKKLIKDSLNEKSIESSSTNGDK